MLLWLTSGLGFLPRPEKFYFSFGERISTAALMNDADDKASQWQVREQVAASIYGLMEDLFAIREKDQATWPTWRKKLTGR